MTASAAPARWFDRACRAAGIVTIAVPIFAAGGTAADPGRAEPVRVSVTLPPQAWLVSRIGGERVEVRILVGPGDSPATFSPSDAQITELARTAIYFRIGVPAESSPWFEAIESAETPRVVDLRQGVALRRIEGYRHVHGHGQPHYHGPGRSPGHSHDRDGEAGGSPDPHIWLSPRRLGLMARTISESLAEADPGSAGLYSSNLERLLADLEALDREIRARLAEVERRTFFVFHPAWGYFADDFGLRQVPIEVAGKEPSDSELTRLTREARERGAGVIFVQPQFQGRSADAVAEAVGARVETLDPLAYDVGANLRHVAERLELALGGGESDE